MENKDSQLIYIVLIVIAVLGLSLVIHSYYRTTNTRDHAEESIRNAEYTCYLDGELIDGSKVDFSSYNIEVNDSKKEVYLSTKTSSSSTMVPFFIPVSR